MLATAMKVFMLTITENNNNIELIAITLRRVFKRPIRVIIKNMEHVCHVHSGGFGRGQAQTEHCVAVLN